MVSASRASTRERETRVSARSARCASSIHDRKNCDSSSRVSAVRWGDSIARLVSLLSLHVAVQSCARGTA